MSDTESETEIVAMPQKKQLSEAKLQALALARQKAAQKAKQRSAVTKAMKDGARVARIADKANALALEQKRKAIESGLIVDEEPVIPVAPAAPNDYTSMRAELASLKDMLLKRFEPPTDIPPPRIKTVRKAKPIPEEPPAPRRRVKPQPAAQPVAQPVPVYPEPARSRTEQLRALLGR